MPELPESVTLDWIARHLIEMRGEIAGLRDDVNQLKDEAFVLTALLQRLDHKVDRIGRRVDALEIEAKE